MAEVIIPLAIGAAGILLARMLAPKPKDQFGSRLSDLNVASVTPGNPITRHWGTMKLPAQIIWNSRLIETANVTETSEGGKGGGSSSKSTSYTYSVDAAFAVCEGEVYSVNRIWANQKLLWVNPELLALQGQTFDQAYYAELDRLYNQAGVSDPDEAYVGAFVFAFNNYRVDTATLSTQAEALAYILAHPGSSGGVSIPAPNSGDVDYLLGRLLSDLDKDAAYQAYKVRYSQLDLYYGNQYQMPNVKMESYLGAGNVPAYRGVCYFVIHRLQLEDFGNAMPTFSVEVTKQSGAVQLISIVEDIMARAGVDEDMYDARYLPSIIVPGYAITNTSSARDALGGLQSVYPFDAVETDYKLVFKWINRRPIAVIDRGDLGARSDNEEPPPSEEINRSHDFDLPKRLNLKYQEPLRNYSGNTVFAQREVTYANGVVDLDIPIALSRTDARTYVEEQMALRFAARRTTKLRLPRKYMIIEPGDAILLPEVSDPTRYYALRVIEQAIGQNGLVELTCVDHLYRRIPTAEGGTDDPDGEDGPEVPGGSPTWIYLVDGPLMTDNEQDNVGFYAIYGGSSNGWPGGILMMDVGSGGTVTVFGSPTPTESDEGTRWIAVSSSTNQALHGRTLSTMGPGHAMCWDRATKLRVRLYNKQAAFSAATEWDVVTRGVNIMLVGAEYVAYTNVLDLGGGLWELSGFLRGLRGTEWAINTHEAGERFATLTSSAIKRITHDVSQLNTEGSFRAITSGDTVDDADTFTFSNTGNSLKPNSPMIAINFKNGNNDRTLEWVPRNRQRGNWLGGSMPVAVDQPSEQYEIDVYQAAVFIKTYSFGATRTWTYTAAQQVTDGVDPADPVVLRLYQIGNVIGRGHVAEVTT